MVLEAGNSRSRRWQDWFPLMPLFLPLLGYPLPMSSQDPSLTSSSYKATGQIGLGSTSMTKFQLNDLFKEPISKCSHMWGTWGWNFNLRNGIGTIQSTALREKGTKKKMRWIVLLFFFKVLNLFIFNWRLLLNPLNRGHVSFIPLIYYIWTYFESTIYLSLKSNEHSFSKI